MKTLIRTGLLLGLLTATSVANADWSANVGFASEYYYRGILQEESSASGGIDYTTSGFYVGTWVADVGDGLEVDGYFGYGTEVGDVGISVGITGYYYTDNDFDDTYQEVNFGVGYGILTLDVALGEYDNFDGEKENYTYYELTAEKNGFFGKYGGFSQDFEGEYFQLGYGATVSEAEIDLGVHLIFNDDDLGGGESDEAIVFTIGKSFDL